MIDGTPVVVCEVNTPCATWFAAGHSRDWRTDGWRDTTCPATGSALHEETVSANLIKSKILLRIKMILSRFVMGGSADIANREQGHLNKWKN